MTFKIKVQWRQQRLKYKCDVFANDGDVVIEEEEELILNNAFPELVSSC